jgi:uncharacterized protein
MGVEVRPLNVLCNLQCIYCYQNAQRDAGEVSAEYDLSKIKEAILQEGGPFTIFGGEPLLMPVQDLEDLWSWGFSQYGENSIQTNGTLLSDEHIRLFHRYKVRAGVSVDGPEELNDIRWHGNLERTRESTAQSQRAIERLCREGLTPGLIITLHRGNAAPDRLARLIEWVRELAHIGVRDVRLHLLESESAEIRERYALSVSENVEALVAFLELNRELPKLRFDLFTHMRRLLMAADREIACIWGACDPYTTRAVRGIEGHGHRSNCGRMNKEGVEFTKADSPGFERYLALYQTPQEDGGCKGCRFFLMCKGQCPGTAIDGDWRNRSEHCEIWKATYEILEADLVARGKAPLSLSPGRAEVERGAMNTWARGREVSLARLVSAYAKAQQSQAAALGESA